MPNSIFLVTVEIRTPASYTSYFNLNLVQSLNNLLGIARCAGNVSAVRRQWQTYTFGFELGF